MILKSGFAWLASYETLLRYQTLATCFSSAWTLIFSLPEFVSLQNPIFCPLSLDLKRSIAWWSNHSNDHSFWRFFLGARYLLHNTSFLYCNWLLGPTLISKGCSFFVFGILTYMLHIGISSQCIYLCDFGLGCCHFLVLCLIFHFFITPCLSSSLLLFKCVFVIDEA